MTRTWRELWNDRCRREYPHYRILVPETVPDRVRQVWDARGYTLTGPQPLLPAGRQRNFIRTKVRFTAVAATGAFFTGSAGLVTLGTSTLMDSVFIVGVASTAGLGALTAGAGLWTGLKYLRDPKRLPRKARQAAARARWITPSDLGFASGRNSRDTDEQRLMQLAVHIADAMVNTKAWSHPSLMDHVSRIDLEHTLASVGERLVELYRLRTELEGIREQQISDRIDVYQRRLSQAFSSIATRIVAMQDYLECLQELSAQLTLLEHTERSQELGDRILDVVSRTTHDDRAQWQFQELTMDAESHARVIADMLADLDDRAEELDIGDDMDRRIAQAGRELRADGS